MPEGDDAVKPVPAYVTQWFGRRVEWRKGRVRLTGRVVEVARRKVEGRYAILLRICRDDGFIEIGQQAEDCTRLPELV